MSSDRKPAREEMYFTPFTLGKIRWWFSILDVDKDGSISEEDFHLIAQRYIQEYQLQDVDPLELRDKLLHGWGSQHLEEDQVRHHIPLIAKMSDNLRAGLKVTQEEFVTAVEQLIENHSELARSTLENMVAALFQVFDYNHDDYITKQEFLVAMRCFGLEEPELVDTVFVCLDSDKDGRLSRQEYTDGWLDLILGQSKDHALVVAFAPHLKDM